jgi:hypothetical protein
MTDRKKNFSEKEKILLKNEPKSITIGTADLKLILYKYFQKVIKSRDWIAPLGLTLSLITTLLVSNFKPEFGINPDQWYILFSFAFIICIGWLIFNLYLSINTASFESLVQNIIFLSSVIEEYRVLFFIKTQSREYQSHISISGSPLGMLFFIEYYLFS